MTTMETDPVCCRCGKPITGPWYWVMDTEQARASCPACAKPDEKPYKPLPGAA